MGKKIFKFCKKHIYIFGILLFIFILSRSNIKVLIKGISEINFWHLILAAFIALPILFLKAWCWNYIKKQQGIRYNLKESFLMAGAGMYYGIVTPGRAGEIIKAFYLKKDGHSLGKSLVGLVMDRLTDFVFLLIYVSIGSLFFLAIFGKKTLLFVSVLILFIVLYVSIIKSDLIKKIGKKIFYFLVPKNLQSDWHPNFHDFLNDLKIFSFANYLMIFFITALSWFAYFFQMIILAKGLHLSVSPLYLTVAVTVAGLLTIIPVSISGIGTREASFMLLFSPFAVSTEKIIIFSALILVMSLFMALIGFFCSLLKPLKN